MNESLEVEFFKCIKIQGSSGFVSHTKEALKMLRKTRCFKEIKPYIGVIKEAQKSSMQVYDKTYEVAGPTWQHSVVWYASTIAHDGYHSKMYHEAKTESKEHEPSIDSWSGTKAEKKCLEFQLRALKELGADKHLIAYVKDWIKNPTYHLVNNEDRWW